MMTDALTTSIVTTSIELYKQSDSTVTSLWGLYSGAALAMLGYILGSRSPVPGRGKIALGAVFLIFALSNASSLWRAQSIGWAACAAITNLRQGPHPEIPEPVLHLLGELKMCPPGVVVGFQLFLTVCALAAIGAAHRHDKFVENEGEKTKASG